MTMVQDFPRKVDHYRVISIAQRSVEEDDTIMGKNPLKKPAAKMESSVYTRGPIIQERSKNWGANGIILSLCSFLKKPKLLK